MTGVIVCYAKCWPCQFAHHPGGPHTWMDVEDIEHEGLPVPTSPADWQRFAEGRPCGCWCVKTPVCRHCVGSGVEPTEQLDDRGELLPCGNCAGTGESAPGVTS